MSGAHTTLAELMIMLTDLHPCHLILVEGVSVRQLRLVNKEVGALAAMAVTSCEVYLGYSMSSPEPLQLVRLFKDTQLQQLKVTVIIRTGLCGVQRLVEWMDRCNDAQMNAMRRALLALPRIVAASQEVLNSLAGSWNVNHSYAGQVVEAS